MPKITVSSKVAELEEHWGVQLLQRTTRTLALTDAGAAFVEVTVQLTDRQVDLVAERFDVAIRAGELPDSTLVGKLIGMAEHRVVASPEYLAQRGTPTRPADLTTHACLCFARSGTPVRTTWPFRSGNRSLDVPVSGAHAARRRRTADAFADTRLHGLRLPAPGASGPRVEPIASSASVRR